MRFHKGVDTAVQELLSRQLEEYESKTKMTKEERRELHKWVASGRSPYDNGDYIYGEDGCPMDFIGACRFLEDQMEWFHSLDPEEQEKLAHPLVADYDTECETPIIHPGAIGDAVGADKELPFQ